MRFSLLSLQTMQTPDSISSAPPKNRRANKEPRNVRVRRYIYNQLFPKRQSPLKVSLAVFIGIFIGILPTWGIAVLKTIIILGILKLPKLPGVLASFVATPPTQFFIFYPIGLWLGSKILPPPDKPVQLIEEIRSMNLSNFTEKFAWLFGSAREYFISFIVGMVIVAILVAFIGALLTWFIMNVRRNKLLKQRELRRLKLKTKS